MCEPLDQDESTDPDLERVRRQANLILYVLEVLFGPRPGRTIVVLSLVVGRTIFVSGLVVWLLATGHASAAVRTVLPSLLRLLQ